MKPSHTVRTLLSFCLLTVALCSGTVAAEVDPARLPPPADVPADFTRDIQPIFEQTCLRCHGAEKPRSGFSLVHRESALHGGEHGVDIIPGDSAHSPLVHYVARLVEDMEMPPPGKGEPLSQQQIALLRAWIDQGAMWATSAPPPKLTFGIAPALRWISVDGNEKSFREIEGLREGWAGGVESFSIREQLAPDKIFSAEGRAFPEDHDYQLKLSLTKAEFGFVRAGVESWRKYYDDSGGYYQPFAPPSYNLNRDLHLDIGRAWIDFGLTRPSGLQLVLGYEYQFRNGDKSTLQWGDVGGKNIYPAAESIDEHTHIVKLELTHEFSGWRLENNARVEFFDLKTTSENANSFTLGPGPDSVVRTHQDLSHVQGQNTVHLERQVNDWLFVAGGYLYSRFDGDTSFDQVTENTLGAPVAGNFWSADDITLKREVHIFSLSSLLRPLEYLSVSTGTQGEWSHQEGFGDIHLDEGDPNLPPIFLLQPAVVSSDLDKQKFSQRVSLRFTKIPWTVLFAEGGFEAEEFSQFEQLSGDSPHDAFLRDTDASNDLYDARVGFNTSPWRQVAFSAHYRYRASDSDYDHTRDVSLEDAGYSAFIRNRRIETDEAQAKLTLRPTGWLRTTLTYRIVATDYETTTDPVPGGISPGGNIFAGNYDAHLYGLNVVLTPYRRLYLSTTLTYGDTRMVTADNGNPSVAPYQGEAVSVISSANFALNPTTDLRASYAFARADYGQDNVADGLPLGMKYTRHAVTGGVTKRWTSNLSTNLRYSFYDYSEPSGGGKNDYTAHGVFAMVAMKWP